MHGPKIGKGNGLEIMAHCPEHILSSNETKRYEYAYPVYWHFITHMICCDYGRHPRWVLQLYRQFQPNFDEIC